jgi:hypothetical protein
MQIASKRIATLFLLLVCLPDRGLALTLGNTDDWLCAGAEPRLVVARELALVAGQGSSAATDAYFLSCIEEHALGLSLRRVSLRKLGAWCAYQLVTPFAESG